MRTKNKVNGPSSSLDEHLNIKVPYVRPKNLSLLFVVEYHHLYWRFKSCPCMNIKSEGTCKKGSSSKIRVSRSINHSHFLCTNINLADFLSDDEKFMQSKGRISMTLIFLILWWSSQSWLLIFFNTRDAKFIVP